MNDLETKAIGPLSQPPVSCLVALLEKGCNPNLTPEQKAQAQKVFLDSIGYCPSNWNYPLTWLAMVIFFPILIFVLAIIWIMAMCGYLPIAPCLYWSVFAFICFYGAFLIVRYAGRSYLNNIVSNSGSTLMRVPAAFLSATCSVTCDGCWTC